MIHSLLLHRLGKYDTYKGSTHHILVEVQLNLYCPGNMILIKDRHPFFWTVRTISLAGKYDTYKGSTPNFNVFSQFFISNGKYDTYKGWLDSGLKLLKKSVYLNRLFNFCYTFIGLLLYLLGIAINYLMNRI